MKIGYKQRRQCVLAYSLGPRNGIREFMGGFTDLEDLEDYCQYLDEAFTLVDLGE